MERHRLESSEPLNRTELFDRVKGRKQYINEALDRLVEGGWVNPRQDGRNTRYISLASYREGDERPDLGAGS